MGEAAALDRASGELVGDSAVHVLADQSTTAEVGATLAPDRQGSGLATRSPARVSTLLEADWFKGEWTTLRV